MGKNFLIMHDYNRPVWLSGYDLKDDVKEYFTISPAVAYYHPLIVQVYIEILYLKQEIIRSSFMMAELKN